MSRTIRRTFRRRCARGAIAVVSAVTLSWLASGVWLASGAKATPGAHAPTATASAASVTASTASTAGSWSGSPSATGASDVSNLGSAGWRVQTSAVATQTGAQISTPGFSTANWLPVANDDAGAPGTEIEALAQNGQCPGDSGLQPVNQSDEGPHSIYYSTNLRSCYGYMDTLGPDTVAAFDVPWWWRTDFTPDLAPGQAATLIVNGVIGSANVWVNGQEVATSSTVTGDYTRYTFNVTSKVRPGPNSLAIEVNPNNPRRCSPWTTWTGTRSRRTTTPASSSRSSWPSTARCPTATRT